MEWRHGRPEPVMDPPRPHSVESASSQGAERRGPSDRRRKPTPMFSRYSIWGGRRHHVRRASDTQGVYVDRLATPIAAVVLLTFFFHCLDALFTVAHLAQGGRELNPFMDYFLQRNVGTFVIVKLGIAGLGLSFLAIHKNFPGVRLGISGLFLLYAGVVGYHLFLILQL